MNLQHTIAFGIALTIGTTTTFASAEESSWTPPSADGGALVASAAPTWILPFALNDGPSLAPPPPATDVEPAERTTIFGLPQNMGPVDRVIRGVIAGSLLGVGIWGAASEEISPVASGVLMGVSAVPALTAATGYCPIYHLVGIEDTF